MVEDTPNWEVFVGAYEGLYRNHPVRVSIPGSEESISHITPELLYTCHRAFYSPKNMALVVCGTADFEQVCRMAEEISPKDAPEIGQRHYGERRAEVHQPVVTRKMQVSLPQCMVGFKDEPVPAGESHLRRSLIGDLAVRIRCMQSCTKSGCSDAILMWITRLFRMAHARSSAARAEIRRLCAKHLSGRLHGWRRRASSRSCSAA